MAVLLGGRAAEQIVFGHLSTGAADDLAKVTDIARAMVTRYGMSDQLGHVALETEHRSLLASDQPYYGLPQRNYSDETATVVDKEVRTLIEQVLERTTTLLTERRELLETAARKLLEAETLDEHDLKMLAGSAAIPVSSTAARP